MSLLMSWRQLFSTHCSKEYIFWAFFWPQVIFVNKIVLTRLLFLASDPEHNDSAFFKIKVNANEETWHNSENEPVKIFYRANFEVINTVLYVNWELLLGDTGIDYSLNLFYSKVYNAIEDNVPNCRFTPSSYPEWYNSELIKLISVVTKNFTQNARSKKSSEPKILSNLILITLKLFID